MKPYDAKLPQKCKICGYQFSHNKQGRFTTHLKKHTIMLNEYLKTYYYSDKDLKCSYELCYNLVDLYRGRPKQYCSRSCSAKSDPMTCITCGKRFDTDTRPHRKTKTCSDNCESIQRSKSTKLWHQSMDENEKEKHFKKIITQTAQTRRKNKTPSWNSGKKGIYSEDTINKIRQATLKQMERKEFKKTRIEKIVEAYLIKRNIRYIYSFILENRQFDFLLPNQEVIIECDGDYWHANPKFYPDPAEWQLGRIKIDRDKNEIALRNDYKIIRFWEDDILNNFESIKCIINDLLATT
ncbi:very short patch repair endonuclease [Radiobacillus kanasensis]|uniref:very short patch repair endonuclease n=1 Tax=Radiobacillus kanasensis TaxID=2844358 RepID=UPI001E3214A2|nr:very short patch repair endonuclease [Radiobacillus kanasensis]UFT97749.1 very short patch repair endonuclease [Radiobacillus kanasensis]